MAKTQHYGIVDADGNLVSVGTVVADKDTLAAAGYTAVKVDGPADGRAWDPKTRKFGDRYVDPRAAERDKHRALLAAAQQPGATVEAKIDALLALVTGLRTDLLPPPPPPTAGA